MTLRKMLFSERKERMKKSKTRTFGLLLSLLLSLCLLCGCGNQSVEVEANIAQIQEETITTEQAKKENTKTGEDQAKKESITGTDKKELTDEKLTKDKNTQEEATKKAAEEAKKIAEEKEKKAAEEETKNSGMEIDPNTGKDKYQTDPVPVGKPVPVEPQEAKIDTSSTLQCTFSIRCDTILNNMEQCEENKKSIVPQNGTILPTQTVTFSSGESVYDVLLRVCKSNGIHMEAEWTPIYNSAYIEGIANLYEFDVGALSGWMYKVNGWFPNYGCSRYSLANGDVVEWVYTCDLGYDVGGGYAVGG